MHRLVLALPFLVLAAAPAGAEPADNEAIRAALSGNTVEGEMALTGPYVEYYDEDGSIRSRDYEGSWRVRDDRMCFRYGEEPATCYEVEINGESVTWLKDGQENGTGTIVPGNPNGF
jgi:hypothetical protein